MKKKTTDEIDVKDLAKRKEVEEKYAFNESGGTAIATSLLRGVRSPEDLMNYAKIDRDIWEIERTIVNKWPMGYVDKSDDTAKEIPLYQVKVWLKKRVIVEQARSIIKAMLSEFAKKAPKIPRIQRKKNDGCLFEVSIFDLHHGKLAWAAECGESYDSKISQECFTRAIEDLIERAKGFPVAKILFPIGNDLYNVDNAANTTTAGTPQSEDGRWQKSFVTGKKLIVDGIMRLRDVAPVDVIVVPGNHDSQRSFMLGEVLVSWFRDTPDVDINNAPTLRKYYRYGKSLLGFTHGCEEKHASLPIIMATERPEDWAATKFREFHVGHLHQKRTTTFQPASEYNGVRVKILPSLCPADSWHKSKGYANLRAAEGLLWDKEQGCVATFSHNV